MLCVLPGGLGTGSPYKETQTSFSFHQVILMPVLCLGWLIFQFGQLWGNQQQLQMCSFLPLRTVHADVAERIGLNSRKTERLNPLGCLLPLPFNALMNDLFFLNYSFPPQMSLMERSAVRPITAVAWTSNSSTCPRDFSLVGEKPRVIISQSQATSHFSFLFLSVCCRITHQSS